MIRTKRKNARKNNGGNNKVADKPIGDQKEAKEYHCCYGDLCGNAETTGTTLIDLDHEYTVQCQSCNGFFHKFGCGDTKSCKKCDPDPKPITDDAVDDEVLVHLGSNVGGVAGNKGGTSKKYLCCMFLLRIDFYLFATMNCVRVFFFILRAILEWIFDFRCKVVKRTNMTYGGYCEYSYSLPPYSSIFKSDEFCIFHF